MENSITFYVFFIETFPKERAHLYLYDTFCKDIDYGRGVAGMLAI